MFNGVPFVSGKILPHGPKKFRYIFASSGSFVPHDVDADQGTSVTGTRYPIAMVGHVAIVTGALWVEQVGFVLFGSFES
jgi:hypothetical protein